MAIVKMDKISLIGLESDKEQIVKALMKLGVIDITSLEEKADTEEWSPLVVKDGDESEVLRIDSDILRVKSAIDYLSRYNTQKKALFAPKPGVDEVKYREVAEGQDKLWDVVDSISRYDEQLSLLKSEENRHVNTIASLMPWKELDIPLDVSSTRSTLAAIGTLPSAAETEKLQQELQDQTPESYFEIINSDKDQYYVFVMYHTGCEEAVVKLLKQYGFSRVIFKDMKGTAAENMHAAEKSIRDIEKKRDEISSDIASLAGMRADLEILHDHLTMERDRKKILSRMVKTGRVFMLEGWLPEAGGAKIGEQLSGKWDCVIDISKPGEEEEYPILLRNHPLVQPFELITELYSLPCSNGLDPNLFMAPFFFIFFGMMVSDAGYGILMMIGTGIMLLKFKLEGMLQKLVKLMFLGGLSTLLWGALFGGWFGDIITAVSGGRYSIPPLWFNPLEDPMKLLIWSFIFGAIQLFTGMGLQGYKLIRSGKVLDAIFDIGFWYVFLIGLALLLVGGSFGTTGKYMAIAGAVLLVLTQGRSEKNIFKKLTTGILSLYNAVGFMSDVLSYSRLLALGLATGVIASVINTIATLFGFNIIGILIMLVVVALGTVFNVLINALGAYVHASRLQYVEFFSKFYEGGGKPYQPFKINTKYINLNDRRTV